jgi:hypothetical protein
LPAKAKATKPPKLEQDINEVKSDQPNDGELQPKPDQPNGEEPQPKPAEPDLKQENQQPSEPEPSTEKPEPRSNSALNLGNSSPNGAN